jgi:hypothetical protein
MSTDRASWRRFWNGLALIAVYAAAWALPRWPAIRANTLFYDDYGVAAIPFIIYVGSYRPTLWIEYRLWELLVPGHFATRIPKLSAAVYWGLACTALMLLLRRWRVPMPIALLLPLVLVAHPVATDAGLWSALSALPLSLFLVIAGVLLLGDGDEPKRLAGGSALILAGILGYQYYFVAAVVLVLAEVVVDEVNGAPRRLRVLLRKLAILASLAAVQIIFMQLARPFITRADKRGFAELGGSLGAFVANKLHGAVDLLVNLWMPLLAWYLDAVRAWSLWKFVPLVLLLATIAAGLAVRARMRVVLLAAAATIALPLLAVMPTFALSQTPYAWRVTIPVLLAAALGMLPLLIWLGRRSRFAPVVLLLVLIAVLLPPTRWEAEMRVVGYQRDRAVFDHIATYWMDHGLRPPEVSVGVGRVRIGDPRKRLPGAHEVTWGYDRTNPMFASPFFDPWAAEQAIATFNHYRFIDCNTPGREAKPVCRAAKSACTLIPPNRTGVVHVEQNRMSFVCEAMN